MYDYVYQLKDHLGNIRVSFSDRDNDGIIDVLRNDTDIDGDGDLAHEILQEKNYYPFGMKHKGYNDLIVSEHNYGFGGKEENDELGLGWLDFQARNYDAAIGRWMNLDPIADTYVSWSPYNYSYNSPIIFTDPTGLGPIYDKDGNITGYEVEEGQGPTQIAKDLNSLDIYNSDVSFLDIVSLNEPKFTNVENKSDKNDSEYRVLNMNPGDVLNVPGLPTTETETTNDPPVAEGLTFEKGKSYPIELTAKTYAGVSAGPLGASFDETIVSYNGETIVSKGLSTGAGLGTEILNKLGAESIQFHADMSGGSLLDVFNQTGLTITKKVGAVVGGGTMTGYDSPNKMNKLWSASLRGSGLKAGVSSDRSTAPFKNKK